MILLNEITAWDYYTLRKERSIVEDWACFNSYIQFIKQQLHPSQFIPWDMESDCPLEKPKNYEAYLADYDMGVGYNPKKCKQYQQAEERVLFKGFEYSYVVSTKHKQFHVFKYKEWTIYYDVDSDIFDYTDLINDYEVKSISDLTDKVDIKDKVAKQLKLM